MAQDLTRRVQIFIDGTAATQSIDKVKETVKQLETQLEKLNPAEANFSKNSEKLKNQIEAKNRTLANYNKKVDETRRVLNNLSGSTYNELIAAQSHVRRELRETVSGTQQHTAALEQNRRVTEAVAHAQNAMRVEVGSQGSVWGRAAGFVNKYMALVGGVVASLTGLSMTIRRSVDDYAQISEAMAGVKKYTGMTDDQVKDLNESFKQMDTRTARERLNELAQDAGRLGIQGKQDILEFVDAANIINVALGEDLGKDAVKNIGKLAQMFGDDKEMGLRGAMLATGSAINEIAQNSSAAESYLVEFTARLAGTGKQAGISQTQIMGFASVLDQDMQQVEMSSTALQNVVMKIYQEPAKFAKMAGMEVKAFTEMMKNDANEALLRFLENIGKMGGLSDTAPLFKEMKLDGVRAAGVLNDLAANVGRVREQQDLAFNAYRDGSSVLNEYNVQNNTVQAGLDKAKKRFQEISYELGEKMLPFASQLITSTGTLVRGLSKLVTVLIEHKGMVTGAAIAIAGLTLVKKADIIATKLLEFWNNKLSFSFKGLNKEMGRNIFGIIMVVLGAYIGKLLDAKRKQDELKNSLEGLKKVNHETAQSFSDQEAKIRALNSILNDNGVALLERRRALDELKKIIPGYNALLSDEGTLTNNNTSAIKDYLIQLEKEIKLKAAKQELEELYKKKRELEKDEKNQDDDYWKTRNQNTLQGYNRNGFVAKVSRYFGTEKEDKALDKLKETQHALQETEQHIADINNEIGQTSVELEKTAVVRTLAVVDKELSAAKSKLKEYLNMSSAERKKLGTEYDQLVSDTRSKISALDKEKKELAAKENSGAVGSGEDPDEKTQKKALKKKIDAEKNAYEEHKAWLKEEYLSGQNETLQTEKQFKTEMECLELEHYQKIIKIAGAKSKEGIDAQNSINDIRIQQKKENIQQQIETENEMYEKQQSDLKTLYASGKDENLKNEQAYNDAMEQLTIMHLQRTLEIAGLDAEQRKAIEEKILDFKVKCMQNEQKARDKHLENEKKKKEDAAKREKQRLEHQAEQYRRYGEQIGESVGNMISGQEDAMRGFADTMIDILFDVLSQLVEIEIAKATGVAVGAVARSAAESYSQADSVATFGATGTARAAILSGLIMGALAAAKSTLKGLVRGGSKSSSVGDSSSAEQTKRASVSVNQWASGRYDVIGEDDGRTYTDIPYIGPTTTGIVRRTSLVSEDGAELIINTKDLSRLQRHINYPVVLEAIQDARNGRVPQRAEGNYEALESSLKKLSMPETRQGQTVGNEEVSQLIAAIKSIIPYLKNLRAYIVWRDIQEAQEADEKSKKPFTRPKK